MSDALMWWEEQVRRKPCSCHRCDSGTPAYTIPEQDADLWECGKVYRDADALLGLPELDARLIQGFIDGMSYVELGRSTGLSAAGAMNRVKRVARQKIIPRRELVRMCQEEHDAWRSGGYVEPWDWQPKLLATLRRLLLPPAAP